MGTLYVVATPIGNLSDVSKRALETLSNVDLIAVEDTRQTIKLLNHFNIKKPMISYHKFNESKRTEELIEKLKSGIDIALVTDAGTPCISDPGYILIKEVRDNGIEVIGIPGASAIITALSISGIDSSSFAFYGFLPTDTGKKKELIENIKELSINSIILYESPKRIVKLAELLNKEFPNCKVCFCSDLTKLYEKSLYGNIADVLEQLKSNSNTEKGEYTVVFEKENIIKKEENISLEALLIDIIIKEKCSIKDAINILNDKMKDISKKDIYNASLNLKEILRNT